MIRASSSPNNSQHRSQRDWLRVRPLSVEIVDCVTDAAISQASRGMALEVGRCRYSAESLSMNITRSPGVNCAKRDIAFDLITAIMG